MSRIYEVAVELFGEKEAASKTTADMYQHLARGVVESSVRIEPVVTTVLASDPINEQSMLGRIIELIAANSDKTLGITAYSIGYEAQMRDALATNAADQYKSFEELFVAYQALK